MIRYTNSRFNFRPYFLELFRLLIFSHFKVCRVVLRFQLEVIFTRPSPSDIRTNVYSTKGDSNYNWKWEVLFINLRENNLEELHVFLTFFPVNLVVFLYERESGDGLILLPCLFSTRIGFSSVYLTRLWTNNKESFNSFIVVSL